MPPGRTEKLYRTLFPNYFYINNESILVSALAISDIKSVRNAFKDELETFEDLQGNTIKFLCHC